VAAALADPELGDGREQAGHQALVLVVLAIEGSREANGQRRGGFAFEREIGQHVLHERLVDQGLAEGVALRRMVERDAQ
jgi:hypothetical protein